MANTITHKRSSTSSDVPSASDLSAGEIAINTADAKLFIKKSDNSIATFETGSSTPTGAQTGITSILNASLVVGRDADNDIDFATDNQIIFRTNGADQIKLTDGALVPNTNNDIDLGADGGRFKDLYLQGTGYSNTSFLSLKFGRDADNDIDFSTDNEVTFRVNAEDQIKLQDGALVPITDNNIDLGTSSIEFKNAYFDGTVTTDLLSVGTISSAVKHTGSYFWFGIDSAILYFGANFEVSLQHIHNIGLRLNSDKTLSFRDSAINIGSPADGDLDINADDEIELNSTLIDINGAVDASSTITAGGRIIVDDTTQATTTTDGSIQTDGGLSVVKDIVVGDDILVGDNIALTSDASIIYFGADSEIQLSHVHNTGLRLNSTRQLQFGDSGTYIHQSADGVLDLVSDTEIEINATTVDINGAVEISGNTDVAGTLSSIGNFDVNTNKFNVNATSGNTAIAGTLDVTGAITGDSLAVTTINTTGGIDVQNSDTTLTRASAGVIAVEGNEVLTSSTGATKGFATAMAIAL